jgi:hypothetical protein
MRYTLNKCVTCLGGLVLAATCAATAWAAPEGAPVQAMQAMQAVPAPAARPDNATAPVQAAPDFGQPADLGKLDQSRGGTDTTHNTANLDGVVSGNSATNVVTGNNIIDAGSFANMSGIPVVIQNSGANVLIQSSTIVNLQFK